LLQIDFGSSANTYRRLHGGGNGQPVAKAVGIKKYGLPLTVIDATAGLGQDSFVLASLGCQVTLIERNSDIAELLEIAIKNARANEEIADIAKRMTLIQGNAVDLLSNLSADVIYLDPMFPERSKSALVKQDMRELKDLVGDDTDADLLLEPARKAAQKRVVVKRPKAAPMLANIDPHVSLNGKSGRFDIYMPIN